MRQGETNFKVQVVCFVLVGLLVCPQCTGACQVLWICHLMRAQQEKMDSDTDGKSIGGPERNPTNGHRLTGFHATDHAACTDCQHHLQSSQMWSSQWQTEQGAFFGTWVRHDGKEKLRKE